MSDQSQQNAVGNVASLAQYGARDFKAPEDLTAYPTNSGFDLIWHQGALKSQMRDLEDAAKKTLEDSNLTDTERMFEMQTIMNAWSAIASLRTNFLKCISDTTKMICRNIV